MNDTPPYIQDLHRDQLMECSNEERFRMGISMCQTARTIVWSSLSDDLDPSERQVQFFLRYYGSELEPEFRDWIVSEIRSQERDPSRRCRS